MTTKDGIFQQINHSIPTSITPYYLQKFKKLQFEPFKQVGNKVFLGFFEIYHLKKLTSPSQRNTENILGHENSLSKPRKNIRKPLGIIYLVRKQNIPKNELFLHTDTHTCQCVSRRGRNVSFLMFSWSIEGKDWHEIGNENSGSYELTLRYDCCLPRCAIEDRGVC